MKLRILLIAEGRAALDREVVVAEGSELAASEPVRHVPIAARPMANTAAPALERALFGLELWIQRRSA